MIYIRDYSKRIVKVFGLLKTSSYIYSVIKTKKMEVKTKKMETKTQIVKEATYMLAYKDSMGRRQVIDEIETREELLRKKDKYSYLEVCKAVTIEVERTYVDGECVNVERTIISE